MLEPSPDPPAQRRCRGAAHPPREEVGQAAQAAEGPRLDRAQRHPEPVGDLGLGEVAEVGQGEDLALLGRQAPEGARTSLARA
jgi:hypothetical protein